MSLIENPLDEFDEWPSHPNEWVEGLENLRVSEPLPRLDRGKMVPRFRDGEMTLRFEHD